MTKIGSPLLEILPYVSIHPLCASSLFNLIEGKEGISEHYKHPNARIAIEKYCLTKSQRKLWVEEGTYPPSTTRRFTYSHRPHNYRKEVWYFNDRVSVL